MNPQVAGASGRGLARLGQTLGQVGVEAGNIIAELARADEDGKMINAEEEWENTYADYQKKMKMTQNSPLDWQGGWDEETRRLSHGIDNMEGSREFKDKLRERYIRWNGRVNRSIGRNATNTSFANTGNAYAARYDRAKSQNDTEGMIATAKEAVAKGYWPEARGYESETEAKQVAVGNDQMYGMRTDPFNTYDDIVNNKWDEDKYTHQRKVAEFKPQVNAARREVYDDALDGIITGGIKERADLDKEEYENLLPLQKDKLANYLENRNDLEYKKFIESPGQQSIIWSKVQDGIYSYKPNGEDSDMGYANVKLLIEQMNPGAYKEEAIKKLNSKQDDKQEEVKDIKTWGTAEINRNRTRALSKIPEPKGSSKKVFDYLEDGYFRNKQNLLDLGFTKGQAKDIMEAYAYIDGLRGTDKPKNYAAQIKMFKTLWQERENQNAGTDFQKEFAAALLTGNINTVLREWDNPEEVKAYERKQDAVHKSYGEMQERYREYFKTHPKAQRTDLELWLKDEGLHIETKMDNDPVLKSRPGRETGAVDRSQVIGEIALNNDTKRLLFASAAAEVGSQGDQAIQAYMETVTNRASATGRSLRSILLDSKYYPDPTKKKLSATNAPDYSKQWDAVARGSNITNFATDNASSDLAKKRIAAGNPYVKIGGETFYVNSHGSGGGGIAAHTDFFNKNTAPR